MKQKLLHAFIIGLITFSICAMQVEKAGQFKYQSPSQKELENALFVEQNIYHTFAINETSGIIMGPLCDAIGIVAINKKNNLCMAINYALQTNADIDTLLNTTLPAELEMTDPETMVISIYTNPPQALNRSTEESITHVKTILLEQLRIPKENVHIIAQEQCFASNSDQIMKLGDNALWQQFIFTNAQLKNNQISINNVSPFANNILNIDMHNKTHFEIYSEILQKITRNAVQSIKLHWYQSELVRSKNKKSLLPLKRFIVPQKEDPQLFCTNNIEFIEPDLSPKGYYKINQPIETLFAYRHMSPADKKNAYIVLERTGIAFNPLHKKLMAIVGPCSPCLFLALQNKATKDTVLIHKRFDDNIDYIISLFKKYLKATNPADITGYIISTQDPHYEIRTPQRPKSFKEFHLGKTQQEEIGFVKNAVIQGLEIEKDQIVDLFHENRLSLDETCSKFPSMQRTFCTQGLWSASGKLIINNTCLKHEEILISNQAIKNLRKPYLEIHPSMKSLPKLLIDTEIFCIAYEDSRDLIFERLSIQNKHTMISTGAMYNSGQLTLCAARVTKIQNIPSDKEFLIKIDIEITK